MHDKDAVLKWLRKQTTMVSFRTMMDKIYLIDELVEQGEFKNRSKVIEAASIDVCCVFAVKDENSKQWCNFSYGWVECNGLQDKQRCPLWVIANALDRIETAIQMLEGRE